jgi:hypothetical protein
MKWHATLRGDPIPWLLEPGNPIEMQALEVHLLSSAPNHSVFLDISTPCSV